VSHFLADAIRVRLRLQLGYIATQETAAALLAVVDKCEQMRDESSERGAGRFLADEFESVIARELNVNIPLEHADEARRLLGD
jgi:hypothetical protein